MLRAILSAVVLLCASAPVWGACPTAQPAMIEARYTDWVARYDAHDLDGTMAIFDPAVVFQFQGSLDQDWAALKAGYVADFAQKSANRWVPRITHIEVSGDLAAMTSEWKYVATGPDGRDVVKITNTGVDILTRNAACEWHIVRSLNYTVK